MHGGTTIPDMDRRAGQPLPHPPAASLAARWLASSVLTCLALPLINSPAAATTSANDDNSNAATALSSLSYGQLPSAPPLRSSISSTNKGNGADGLLFLELILNGRRTGQIIPVYLEQDSVRLRPQDLQQQGVDLHVNGDHLLLGDIPDARFEYHVADQSLSIDLPTHLLPSQNIGPKRRRLDITPADTAFLLNYDAFISTGFDNSPAQISVFLEQRIAAQFGSLSTSGFWRNGPHGGYKRYDTSFRTSHADSSTTWEFGDFITRSLADASAVRLGGVQISRDFSVRPDIITYPLPRFAGRAALPSTVELLIDGRSVTNTQVDPGQFLLDTLPFSSGAGEAQLVVTDMHGQATTTSLPFYISSNLLASGLTDFAISAGFFRQDYARKNFSYGDFAASASLRHGISDNMTGELRAETSDNFWLIGGGLQSRLATLGVLSASGSYSQHRGQNGHALTIGYDYQAGRFSMALRHMRQSRFFVDLGKLDLLNEPSARRHSLASVNLSMGRYGSMGLNYVEYQQQGQDSNRYANLHWSVPVGSRWQIYAQAGRDFSPRGWNASVAATLSLGPQVGSITAGVTDQSRGERSYRADYSRALPTDGGFGWNVGANISDDGRKNWRGDVQLRTQAAQFRVGGFGYMGHQGRNQHSLWAGVSGGMVLIDGFFVAANQLPSSFALVSTNGYADIPVRYEHQLIGRTNQNGHLFLPAVTPWYAAKIAIDPLDLPANVSVAQVEQSLAIASGRGAHVRFNIRPLQPALASIRGPDGQFIAAGSPVYIGQNIVTYIGWDGLLYLEDSAAAPDARILIIPDNSAKCTVTLPLHQLTPDQWMIGELPCLPAV
ncbi:fimbria/pilus outer membrane usher protein [Sphingopyxis yananensis]|uniref:fimbria/pilus outer membrane usher protein n=1 Tax=Sphingopyxis yananensis TaxID=2886687 RepID=UPI001D11A0B5|nr:fimbria/pilus outer membrane usher protein [Sphingopyxis yananensis]MCC2601944.1 fimbria/pilus outer membrane usher protein [Sphingopyxis yananensis]